MAVWSNFCLSERLISFEEKIPQIWQRRHSRTYLLDMRNDDIATWIDWLPWYLCKDDVEVDETPRWYLLVLGGYFLCRCPACRLTYLLVEIVSQPSCHAVGWSLSLDEVACIDKRGSCQLLCDIDICWSSYPEKSQCFSAVVQNRRCNALLPTVAKSAVKSGVLEVYMKVWLSKDVSAAARWTMDTSSVMSISYVTQSAATTNAFGINVNDRRLSPSKSIERGSAIMELQK